MNNKPFHAFTTIVCIAAGALGGYWSWKYEGLYRWLAEWQLRHFQSYEAQLTLLFTCGILIAPPLITAVIVHRLRGGASVPGAPGAPAAAPARAHPISDAIQLWLGRWWWTLTLGAVGGFLTFWGVYYAHRGGTAGEVTHVAAADFDAGRIPTKHWLAITGNAVMDQHVAMSSQARATYYIPVVSENFDPRRGITLFLKAQSDKIDDDVRGFGGQFVGMLTNDSLPGMVRVEFERQGTTPAKDYRILDLGRTPSDDLRVGRDMLIFGGALLVAAIACAVWPWWKQRRPAPRESAVAGVSAPAVPDPRFRVKAIVPLGIEPQSPPPTPDD